MNIDQPQKKIIIDPTRGLYKWSKIFNRLQRNFFTDSETQLRREKQIEDFVYLNGYQKIWMQIDTDILHSLKSQQVSEITDADITIVTDQKFSRYPCPIIIEKIKGLLESCPVLYLCLNRHYINIDNSFHDQDLDDNFTVAIGQWLRKNLPYEVIDLSLDYIDYGHAFTWAVADRHFLIRDVR